MKLAIREWVMYGKSLEEKFQNAKKDGFEGVELTGPNQRARMPEVRKAMASTGMKISMAGGGAIFTAQKEKLSSVVASLSEAVEVAGELGAVGILVTPSFAFMPKEPLVPDLSPLYSPRQLMYDATMKVAEILGKKAEKAGVFVVLEPLNRYETPVLNTLEQGMEMCQKIGHPNVKLMADFFHMHLEETDVAAAIKKAAKVLANVHLADSNRALPGTGHTDFAPGFAALKNAGYKHYLGVECSAGPNPAADIPKSVRFLRDTYARA
jgi:sugar phosphate isomerase/epimerase